MVCNRVVCDRVRGFSENPPWVTGCGSTLGRHLGVHKEVDTRSMGFGFVAESYCAQGSGWRSVADGHGFRCQRLCR